MADMRYDMRYEIHLEIRKQSRPSQETVVVGCVFLNVSLAFSLFLLPSITFIYILAGALSYDNNPGFDVNVVSQYQVKIQVQDKCGTAQTVVSLDICDTVPPVLSANTGSVTIVEKQVCT